MACIDGGRRERNVTPHVAQHAAKPLVFDLLAAPTAMPSYTGGRQGSFFSSLLEAGYENSLCVELGLRGIPFQRQVPIAVEYKAHPMGDSRLDLLVAERLVVELKAVESLETVHVIQLRSYLRVTGQTLGLLITFNVPVLRGVKRVILSPHKKPSADPSVPASLRLIRETPANAGSTTSRSPSPSKSVKVHVFDDDATSCALPHPLACRGSFREERVHDGGS